MTRSILLVSLGLVASPVRADGGTDAGADGGPSCLELVNEWQAFISGVDRSCIEDDDCGVAGAVQTCDCAPSVAVSCGVAVRWADYQASQAAAIEADFLARCDQPAICDCGEWRGICPSGTCILENTVCCLCTCGDGECLGPPDETCENCPEDCGACPEPHLDAAVDAPSDAGASDAPVGPPPDPDASSGSDGCSCVLGRVPGPASGWWIGVLGLTGAIGWGAGRGSTGRAGRSAPRRD